MAPFGLLSLIIPHSLHPGRRHPLRVLIQPIDGPGHLVRGRGEVVVDHSEVEGVAVPELHALTDQDHGAKFFVLWNRENKRTCKF